MAPPFRLLTVPAFDAALAAIERDDPLKYRKVLKTVRLLRDQGPSYPGLQAHRYLSLAGPRSEPLWEVCVENRTPGAWRLWWGCGPGADAITLVMVGPHP